MKKAINQKNFMSTNEPTKQARLALLSWLLIPVLAVWLTTNYLVATFRKPTWTQNQNVLGTSIEATDLIEHSNKKWEKSGIVTFWFHSPTLKAYRNAMSVLRSENIDAVLSLTPESIGQEKYMNWTQVKKLQSEGWEIASIPTHCNAPTSTSPEVEVEVLQSKRELELRGIPTNIFLSTCGTDQQIIHKYYLTSLSTNIGTNPLPLQNYYDLNMVHVKKEMSAEEITQLIEQAQKSTSWIILMLDEDIENLLPAAVTAVRESRIQVGLPTWVINSVR
jgi:hypothetical protein